MPLWWWIVMIILGILWIFLSWKYPRQHDSYVEDDD